MEAKSRTKESHWRRWLLPVPLGFEESDIKWKVLNNRGKGNGLGELSYLLPVDFLFDAKPR